MPYLKTNKEKLKTNKGKEITDTCLYGFKPKPFSLAEKKTTE